MNQIARQDCEAVYIPIAPRLYKYAYTAVSVFLLWCVVPAYPLLFHAICHSITQGSSAGEFVALFAAMIFVVALSTTGVVAMLCVCMNSGPVLMIDALGVCIRMSRATPVIWVLGGQVYLWRNISYFNLCHSSPRHGDEYVCMFVHKRWFITSHKKIPNCIVTDESLERIESIIDAWAEHIKR